MTDKQEYKQRQNGFTIRTALIMIIGVFIIVAIGAMVIHNNVKNIVDKSIIVEEYYKEGYYAGQEDASNKHYYRRTKIDNFDKLLPECKLAFDAGYGYGYHDYYDDISNEDPHFQYVPWNFSDFAWHIYSLLEWR